MATNSDHADHVLNASPAFDPSHARRPAAWPRVLVFALYGLLIDAGVETWWSGSPVRWWIVAAMAIYAVATALLWRWITWRSKATISAFVFLGLVATTAWLPGGLSTGVRIAGRQTATLLSVLSAAGVALAGAVVWRFRAVPRALRTGVVLLAAYGLSAFAYGVIAGVPFAALFNGDSLWQELPAALQGAFVGGLIVLPVAFLVSVVRAGIPRFREGSAHSALYQGVALATCFAMVLAALPPASESGRASEHGQTASGVQVPEVVPIAPSPALSDALENSLRAIEDGERESPRDRWDAAYVVAQVGQNPQDLFEWVARNTFWIPYRGALRGSVGVLMDRMGSSLDRAVLLATLLKQAGHSVRLAHGELPRDRAAALLPALVVARSAGLRRRVPPPPDAGDVRQVADQYHLDGSKIEQALASSTADGKRVFSSLGVRVVEQTARLRAAVAGHIGNGARQSGADAAIDVLRDHWWVQRLDAGVWVDLDLLSPDMKPMTAALETAALDSLPSSQLHQVVVRLVSEQWNNGRVAERVALEHVLSPSDLMGKPIVLRFWPRLWPTQFPPSGADPKDALRTAALAQHEWVASLQIGRETAARSSILESGDVNDHPMINEFSKIGSGARSAVGDVASLLGDIGSEGAAPPPTSMLTAAWFEFEVRTPGQPTHTIRHPVFDLLGPSARASSPVPRVQLDEPQRLARSLSLTMETEILPVVCRVSGDFVTHLLAQSVLGNRDTLRQLVHGDFSEDTSRPEEAFNRLQPMPSPLYTLARARLDWNRFGDDVYIDSVDILTRHVFFAPSGGRIALRDATDIVANDVGVDFSIADPVAVRLEQGVLDTNAEAQLQSASTVLGSPAQAFASSNDWVTLTSPGDPQLASLGFSNDDRRRVAQDLAGGAVIVAPKAPVRVGGNDFVGWWRIDPATGRTLGVDSKGWGPAMAEYALVLEGAFVGFLFAYLQCKSGPGVQGTPPMVSEGDRPGTQRAQEIAALGYLVAPLAAAPSPCLGIAYSAAAVGALLGIYAAAYRGGAPGESGGGATGGGSGGAGEAAESAGGPAGAGGGGSGNGGSGNGGGSNGGSGSGGSGGPGAGGGGGAAPGESAGEAQPPRGAPPTELPSAPPKGPYRGDPVGRDLVAKNPNSIASQAMGGPELFEGADQAATKAYNAGRQMGMSDENASALSRDAWDQYVQQWTPRKFLDVPYGHPGREVVPGNQPANPLGGTLPAGGTLPLQGAAPCGGTPCGVSPQAKSIGGLTNLGNVLKGGS